MGPNFHQISGKNTTFSIWNYTYSKVYTPFHELDLMTPPINQINSLAIL